MTSPRANSRRSGRARLAELVVWDVILLCLVIGLFVVEQNLPAQAATGTPPPRPTPPAPPPVAATQPPPPRDPSRPGRMPVATEPATEALEPEPTPTPARVTEAPPPAPDASATAEAEVRALLERGDVEAAVGRADRALRSLAAQGGAAPKGLSDVARQAQAKLVAADAAAALLPEVQLLADAGKKDEVEKLLAPFKADVPPELARERERARGRAGKAPGAGGGFTIKAFNPDGSKLEGRRCTVEGDAEKARLEVVRDAVDGVLLLAEGLLAGALPGRVTVKLQPQDGDSPAPAPLVVNVHLRGADEPAALLVDRARLAAARAAWTTLGGVGAAKAPAWLSGGIPRYLAGTDASVRPAAPTALGRVWSREARRRAPGDLVKDGTDPATTFALVRCAIDGPEEGCEPLRRFLRAALTRLEAGEAVEGTFPTLDPAQSGRLADACRAFLAEGTP